MRRSCQRSFEPSFRLKDLIDWCPDDLAGVAVGVEDEIDNTVSHGKSPGLSVFKGLLRFQCALFSV